MQTLSWILSSLYIFCSFLQKKYEVELKVFVYSHIQSPCWISFLLKKGQFSLLLPPLYCRKVRQTIVDQFIKLMALLFRTSRLRNDRQIKMGNYRHLIHFSRLTHLSNEQNYACYVSLNILLIYILLLCRARTK